MRRRPNHYISRRELLKKGLLLGAASLGGSLNSALAQTVPVAFFRKKKLPQLSPSTPLASADISASQSSFTFNSLSFGDPYSTRRIFAFFAWRDGATISDPTSCTIGGVTANIVARNGYETTSVVIYEALIPTGTSGNVTINFGENISYGCSCTLLRFIDLTTTPDFSTSREISKGSLSNDNYITPAALSNVPANSYVIAIGALQNASSNLSWSSYSEVIERNGANGFFQYSIAVTYYPTAQASVPQTFYGAGNTTQTVCHNFIY